jgi:hypothetical protein
LAGGVAFHYSRVRRKEDTELKRKTKKREWLLAMYKDGLAKEVLPGTYGSSISNGGKEGALLLPPGGSGVGGSGYLGHGSSAGTADAVASAFERAKMGNENYAAFLAADEEAGAVLVAGGGPRGGRRAAPRNSGDDGAATAAAAARVVAPNPSKNEAIMRALDPTEGSACFKAGRAGDQPVIDEDPELAAELDAVLGDMGDVLSWSAELDYEAYVANWHVLATSGTAGSNYHAPHHRGAGAGRGPPPRNGGATGRGGNNNAIGSAGVVPEPAWEVLHAQLTGGEG